MQFVLFKDGAFKKFYSSLKIFPYCFNAIFFMSVSSFLSVRIPYICKRDHCVGYRYTFFFVSRNFLELCNINII